MNASVSRWSAFVIVFLSLLTGRTTSVVAERIDDRPNIIWVFCDDMGWADLGANGSVDDAKTPNLDDLAERGVRFTSGTITAPQCSPSRAGLLTGRYQQRFGFGHIGLGPLPLSEITIAERLADAGYATGMIGKWHLEPNAATPDFNRERTGDPKRVPPPEEFLRYFPEQRGFTDVYKGEIQQYRRTYRLNGQDLPEGAGPIQTVQHPGYRLTTQTQAALAFITRHRDQPFFLYLAYFAPHVPLEATPELLMRFPGPMAERRRHALAMNAAMDDGVGAIVKRLETLGLADNTMIVFLSDNGAPIKITKEDRTLEWKGGAWDGSINDPLNGEKGTILEGGIRVPFVMAWPGQIPGGQVVDEPISSLDLAATSMAMAGLEPAETMDGVDLLPSLVDGEPIVERDLFWRFWGQSAVRRGDWKLLVLATGERYLFNLADDPSEQHNLASEHPDRVDRLYRSLESWAGQLEPAGLPSGNLNDQEQKFYEAFLGRPIDR
ncbi:MAG: sulfatase-like hydrolase/transferase [Planctomycetota bacterium]